MRNPILFFVLIVGALGGVFALRRFTPRSHKKETESFSLGEQSLGEQLIAKGKELGVSTLVKPIAIGVKAGVTAIGTAATTLVNTGLTALGETLQTLTTKSVGAIHTPSGSLTLSAPEVLRERQFPPIPLSPLMEFLGGTSVEPPIGTGLEAGFELGAGAPAGISAVSGTGIESGFELGAGAPAAIETGAAAGSSAGIGFETGAATFLPPEIGASIPLASFGALAIPLFIGLGAAGSFRGTSPEVLAIRNSLTDQGIKLGLPAAAASQIGLWIANLEDRTGLASEFGIALDDPQFNQKIFLALKPFVLSLSPDEVWTQFLPWRTAIALRDMGTASA